MRIVSYAMRICQRREGSVSSCEHTRQAQCFLVGDHLVYLVVNGTESRVSWLISRTRTVQLMQQFMEQLLDIEP